MIDIDTIIISVTSKCNLACSYCQNRPAFASLSNLVRMPVRLLGVVIEGLLEVTRGQNGGKISFCYSGGEPLFGGREFYKQVVALQQPLVQAGICVRNIIQTNATLVDEEWARFFKANDFQVSVSIDGLEQLHESQRPHAEPGKRSFVSTINGISTLIAHGVPFGTLSVVSQNSVGYEREILDFFSFFRPNMMGFLPCVDFGPVIGPKEFGDFMIALFDAWLERNEPSVRIREFEHIIKGMLSLPRTVGCQWSGVCPRHVNLTPRGEVTVCDQYIGKEEGYLGNLNHQTLRMILESERFSKFRAKTALLPRPCLNCKYLELCNGGCAYRRNMFTTQDYMCLARKRLFAHIESQLSNKVLPLVARLKQVQEHEAMKSTLIES